MLERLPLALHHPERTPPAPPFVRGGRSERLAPVHPPLTKGGSGGVEAPARSRGPTALTIRALRPLGRATPATGMAGLIQAALALYHRVRPPDLHAIRPWIHADPAAPRRVEVKAIGSAGSCAGPCSRSTPPRPTPSRVIRARCSAGKRKRSCSPPRTERVWPIGARSPHLVAAPPAHRAQGHRLYAQLHRSRCRVRQPPGPGGRVPGRSGRPARRAVASAG